MPKVFQIRGVVKNYDWGKLGMLSSVATICKSSFPDIDISPDQPYAELWMGTHLSGPSTIPSLNNMTLKDWLADRPESLGSQIIYDFGENGLPFLFKVLSIRKALSIQVHPDKETAEKLHKEFSDRYPDDNHKPELAISLTAFKALCGFRPVDEIKAFIEELPQLQKLIGNEIASPFLKETNIKEEHVKAAFTSLITSSEEVFKPFLNDLVDFFNTSLELSDLCKSIKEILLTLHREYPGDIGCFCVFFLNYLNLSPGEAIFLAAGVPHAYLEGDCIECMACSDNVVRAGLTPKFKDVDTLCELLDYSCKPSKRNMFEYEKIENDPFVQVFIPPVPEFSVVKIEIPSGVSTYTVRNINSASILIVIEGNGLIQHELETIKLHHGTIIFISSDEKVEIKVESPKMLMYRAFC